LICEHASKSKFPVLFPVSREFASGDGFDNDYVRHHAPWRTPAVLATLRQLAVRRAFYRSFGLCRDTISPEGYFDGKVSTLEILVPGVEFKSGGGDRIPGKISLEAEGLSLGGSIPAAYREAD
jgi:hypothetical protein